LVHSTWPADPPAEPFVRHRSALLAREIHPLIVADAAEAGRQLVGLFDRRAPQAGRRELIIDGVAVVPEGSVKREQF
jgi:hypothetical protein